MVSAPLFEDGKHLSVPAHRIAGLQHDEDVKGVRCVSPRVDSRLAFEL